MISPISRASILFLLWTVCSATVGVAQSPYAASADPRDARVLYFDGCRHTAAFSPDGRYVLTDEWDGAELCSSRGELLRTFNKTEEGQAGYVMSAALSPDGTRVATGSYGGGVALWKLSGALDVEIPDSLGKEILCVAFSPDGRWIAAGSTDNLVRIWGIDGSEVMEFAADPDLRPEDRDYRYFSTVSSLCFSPGGRLLAVSVGERVLLWDISGDLPVHLPDFSVPGSQVAFSPDGQVVAAAGGGFSMDTPPPGLWNLDGSPVATLESELVCDALAFRPDGLYVAVAARNGTVLIWDTGGNLVRQISKPGEPYHMQVAGIAWSPDLLTIAIAEGYCR